MGSSPVTATIRSEMDFPALLDTVRAALPTAPSLRLLVAFSGGPDSTALLYILCALARNRALTVEAAHLDHGLDAHSAARARTAGRIAGALGIPFHEERREVAELRHPGESMEEAARRIRYDFLEEVRQRQGCTWMLTAHHRDDQAETVLLRILQGTGLGGLRGIAPRRGRVLRPLLALAREDLEVASRALHRETGLLPCQDPTNRSMAMLRNRIRSHLLPRLQSAEPEAALALRLAALAAASRRAFAAVDRTLIHLLEPRPLHGPLAYGPRPPAAPRPAQGGLAVRRAALLALPTELRPHALSLLHRLAGAPYPATAGARRELARQLGSDGRIGCDCGGGWRWESQRSELVLLQRELKPRRAAYTREEAAQAGRASRRPGKPGTLISRMMESRGRASGYGEYRRPRRTDREETLP